jgi:hypothetical protein
VIVNNGQLYCNKNDFVWEIKMSKKWKLRQILTLEEFQSNRGLVLEFTSQWGLVGD